MRGQYIFEEPQTAVVRWLTTSGKPLDPELRRRLFATTYSELSPVLIGGSNALAVSLTAYIRLGSPALLVLAAVDALLLCLRVALVQRGRRPGMPPDLLILCGLVWCVLQVVTVAIVLQAGDTLMSLVLLGSCLGTIGGIVGRNYPAPRYAMAQILILFVGYEVSLAATAPEFIPLLAVQCVILAMSSAALLRTMRRNALAAIEQQIESRQQAISDPLTQLLNRRGFEISYEGTASGDGSHALFCLDLDGFKPVNDRLGHPAGDEVLRGVAARLVQALPKDCAVGRLGGDEFAVLAPAAGEERARDLGARMVAALRQPFALENAVTASIGVSIGGVLLSGDRAPLPAALKQADLALYSAKRSGKGRCVLWDPRVTPERSLDETREHAA